MYFNETYHSYLLPGPHDTDYIFKVVGARSKSQDIFRQSHADQRFASMTFYFCVGPGEFCLDYFNVEVECF